MNLYSIGKTLIFASVVFVSLYLFKNLKLSSLISDKADSSNTINPKNETKSKSLRILLRTFPFPAFFVTLWLSKNWLLSSMFSLALLFLPRIIAKLRKKQRQKLFLKQFLPALNQISNIVKSGSSVEEAFALVAHENPPPISDEFSLVLGEYKICHDLKTSLNNLADRMPGDEVKLFVNSLIIAKRSGANIVEQLGNIQRTISDRMYMEDKVKAMTTQGKIQGIVSSIIPPGIVFVVSRIDPQYFKPLIETKLGRIIITCAILMNVIGLLMIIKLSKFKF